MLRLLCAQSVVVGAAKLMAGYRTRLSTRHRQQARALSPDEVDAHAERDSPSRAYTTATRNRASLDALLEEISGWSVARE